MTIITATDLGADLCDEEANTQAELLEQKRAQVTVEPQTQIVVATDGGEPADDVEPLDVGDHVQDADEPDATMVVIRECDDLAGEYSVPEYDETVAEYNNCDPQERVYQIVFANRTDKDLADLRRYPYPRSRLEVVSRVHDRDDTEGGEE
ncbi:hypothetical protein GS429_08470 [Natronorubrum sp. JWXQ-INN-674]|uniref:Uncharacterized protein n=1 Tax=Natronorubrum halalkaliphilum TaxID=2691917 RepID=A0A6B0VKK9_9EURY|nr:hypothetical protein [Natronorubrum halalkaliphilum]MXV62094.1 hypothetical protein [Natronorubrum halalkaliphilum]